MRRILGGTLLVLMLAFLSSCHDTSVAPVPAVTGPRSEAPLPSEPYLSQEYLAHLWQVSEETDYEWITGTVSAVTGGSFTGSAKSWTRSNEFSITIPPNAMPLGSPALSITHKVQISIGVPRPSEDPSDSPPPVFRLEPDGLQFSVPVTVHLTCPYWRLSTKVKKFCLFQNPDGTYGYSDFQLYLGDPVQSVQFQTRHFSRWPTDDGKGG